MTISSTTSKVKFTGNGSTTVWSFSFSVYAASDLVVTLTNSAGVETTLTEGTGASNYSVSVASYPGTGSITYPATGSTRLQGSESLTISRVIPLTQTIDLQNQGGYFPDVQEEGFDRGIYVSQQLKEESDRAIKIPVSDSGVSLTLPAAAVRSGKVMSFDASGNVEATQSTGVYDADAVTAAAASASAAAASESAVDADVTAFYGAFDVTSLGLNFVAQDYRWQEDDTISPIVAKTGAYSVLATDHDKIIDVTNTTTITLPAVATVANGFHVTIRNADSNIVTVDGNGSETIRSLGENTGVQNFTLRFYGQSVKLVNNGSLWIAEHNMQPLVPVRAVTSTGNIVWSDNGFILDTSNVVTLTLPTISTVPVGFNCKVRAKDDNNLKTIQRGGSDTISAWGDTALTAIKMYELGDWVEFVSDGTVWIAVGDVNVTLRYYTDWPTPTPVAVTTATDTKVLFDTVNRDTLSGWDAGNYWYTIPSKGTYEIHAWVSWEPLSAHDFEAEMWLFNNGTLSTRALTNVMHVAADTSYSDHVVQELHGLWSGSVGDRFGIGVRHNYGSNINIHPAASSPNNNYFSIRRVGNN